MSALNTVNPATNGVSLVAIMEQFGQMQNALAALTANAQAHAPADPKPVKLPKAVTPPAVVTPAVQPVTETPKRMITKGKGGKVLHDSARRLSMPAKVAETIGKRTSGEDFDPIAHYQIDTGSIVKLADGCYIGVSVAEKYFGNVVLIGFTRKAISFNPKTFMALASLDWKALAGHVEAILPVELLA